MVWVLKMRSWQGFLRKGVGACLVWIVAIALIIQPVLADPLIEPAPTEPVITEPTGAALFSANCAACHAGGGNIIRRGKNLKQRAMKRNGFGEVGAIASIVTKGKGAMPAFADRLTGDEIEAIAQYVHEQSEAGW